MNPFKNLRLPVLVAASASALAIGGCGLTNRPTNPTGVSQDELSAGGQPYFNAGKVTYQVENSRVLNPYQTDEVKYFSGMPAKQAQNLPGTQMWYGVFMWAKNQSPGVAQSALPADFKIVDSAGNTYPATTLSASKDPYAWEPKSLQHDQIQPDADSTAGEAPNGGGLILFKLPTTVYSNRPLTLEIMPSPNATKPISTVSLDL